MTITVRDIFRYPVKGLNGERLEVAALQPGGRIAHDRRFAIAHASSQVDPLAPRWMPKINFLNLARDDKLAQIGITFDPETTELTFLRRGRPVAHGKASEAVGRMVINQFLAGVLPPGARGNPKLVEAAEGAFSDVSDAVVSLVSLSSVADIERVARQKVDPRRFRANLYFDGAEPWAERDWVGREIGVGSTRLRVAAPIGRCAATNVDPESAARDMNIPLLLERGFGHTETGVYAEVVAAGEIRAGDTITLPESS